MPGPRRKAGRAQQLDHLVKVDLAENLTAAALFKRAPSHRLVVKGLLLFKLRAADAKTALLERFGDGQHQHRQGRVQPRVRGLTQGSFGHGAQHVRAHSRRVNGRLIGRAHRTEQSQRLRHARLTRLGLGLAPGGGRRPRALFGQECVKVKGLLTRFDASLGFTHGCPLPLKAHRARPRPPAAGQKRHRFARPFHPKASVRRCRARRRKTRRRWPPTRFPPYIPHRR